MEEKGYYLVGFLFALLSVFGVASGEAVLGLLSYVIFVLNIIAAKLTVIADKGGIS